MHRCLGTYRYPQLCPQIFLMAAPVCIAALVHQGQWPFFIFVFLISDGGTLLAGYIQSTAEGFEATRPETIKELGEAIYVQELQDIKSTTASIVFLDNLFRKAAVGLMLTIMLSVITRKKMPDPANN